MKVLKLFSNHSFIQPVLSVILIALLVIFIVQFVDGRNGGNDNASLREVSRRVTLDDAFNTYTNKSFESYTRGSLLVKNSQNFTPVNGSINPQNSSQKDISATENRYNDLFFLLDKGSVMKLNMKTYGQSESLFFNQKGEIVFVSDTDRAYTVYPIPEAGQNDAELLFSSTKQMLQDMYPLIPLLRDYKAGKFNPIERAVNIYGGKWQHQLFTSDEIVDVYIETNPVNGNFASMTIMHTFTESPSRIFFDFKEVNDTNSAFTVPNGYAQVELKTKYKAKQS